LEPRNVTRRFGAMLKKAGLLHIRLHGTRHTAATLMLVQGIPVKVVSEILGHALSGITKDIYQHVVRSQQKDAANRMDALLSRVI
jgi:integrase